MTTKQCKQCRTEIDSKASRCPHCQSDLRNWWQKHPVLTIILIIFVIPPFLSGFSMNSNTDNKSSSRSETISSPTEKLSKTPVQVKEDLSGLLEQANQKVGFQFYRKVNIENYGAYWATFTVSDDWYNLEPYIQERLVKVTVNYYKQVEGGLNRLAEVSLKDSFGKEVATGYYGAGGIEVKILK